MDRKESSLQSWRRWLDKDLSSRPCGWLRPDLSPPAPYLIRPRVGLGFWSSLLWLMPIFGKPGCPLFRREGQDPVTPEAFLDFLGSYLEQASLSSPVLTGEDLHATVLAKKATSGGLVGWGWNELKALRLSWYVGLAWILLLAEDTGRWPEALLDAYITMEFRV